MVSRDKYDKIRIKNREGTKIGLTLTPIPGCVSSQLGVRDSRLISISMSGYYI